MPALNPPLDPQKQARDALRNLLSRLALVSVQGEQLQSLCDDLAPVIRAIRRDPQLAETAGLLASAVLAASGVARDIAVMADVLRDGLQPPGLDSRLPAAPPSIPEA
ncbi:hypothetical protein [Aquabacterium sp.]|uniref:hypothetical protein n=1 Tax=Aquabacterium sp. TaxID=1872578 RepID=UPI002BBE6ED7|nr:hypothetical protein [Aquabacterium sp.]HSW08308.1 hypothetical protein [Aquabacterium sp.]